MVMINSRLYILLLYRSTGERDKIEMKHMKAADQIEKMTLNLFYESYQKRR